MDSEINARTAIGSQVGLVEQFSEDFTQNTLEAAAAQAAQITGLILNYPQLVSSMVNQQLAQALEDGNLGKSAMPPQFRPSLKPSERVAQLLEAGKAASQNSQALARLKALPSASQDG